MRDMLYAPEKMSLDVEQLEPEWQKVGQGLLYIAQCVEEERRLAKELSKGNLSVPLPPPENEFAAPLKAIHALLKHLTWQTQQVAKGDYNQHIDYLGEFADAFNTMIAQLEARRIRIEEEIEANRQKTKELEQSTSLLQAVTERIPQWIIVVAEDDGENLYTNHTAEKAMAANNQLAVSLEYLLRQRTQSGEWHDEQAEAELSLGGIINYYRIDSYPVHWQGRGAVAHIITDISSEKERVMQLENVAYRDSLTQVHNRIYGMQILKEWIEEDDPFCLCFIDLDNLKYVNDTFGHSEGDRYIVGVAETLSDSMPNAVVCRLGGDEFMVLQRGIDITRMETQVAMIRKGLMQGGADRGLPYARSISYGIVETMENNRLTASELLGLADEKMYAFKRQHKLMRGQRFDGEEETGGL